MSSIPNAVMPHASAEHEPTVETAVEQTDGNIARLVDTVKAHPRTGIAIGASLVLGAVAAVAVPALRAKPAAPKKRATTAKRKTPAKRRASASAATKAA